MVFISSGKHGVKSSAESEESRSGLEFVVWEGDQWLGQSRKEVVDKKEKKD